MLVSFKQLKAAIEAISKTYQGDSVRIELDGDRCMKIVFITKDELSQEARIYNARSNQKPVLYSFSEINTDK